MKKATKWDTVSYSSIEEEEKQLLRECLLSGTRELVDATTARDRDVDCHGNAELMQDFSSELSKLIVELAVYSLNIKLHESQEQYDRLKFHLGFAYKEWVRSDNLLSDLIQIDNEVRAKYDLPAQEGNDDAGESGSV